MALVYTDTFITVSEDCEPRMGLIPPPRGGRKTAALIQYELLADRPYEYTMEDILFETHIRLNGLDGLPEEELAKLREEFFSTPKACLRASALPKKYGWGFHFDGEGRVALYGAESPEYGELSGSKTLKVLKGMRSKRA